MKKLVLATILIIALSSVAFASPLTDYSKGKAALDVNYRVSPDYDVTTKVSGNDIKAVIPDNIPTKFDGDNNFEWGFTYGIGNNWALQYRQATPKAKLNLINESAPTPEITAKDTYLTGINADIEAKTRLEEYNVLYKLDKNFSLFTGIVKATPSARLSAGAQFDREYNYSGDIGLQGRDKNIWQFGFVAVKPLNKNLTTYGLASIGSDYHNWEVGLGYKLIKDVELNVNYRNMKIEDMKVANLTAPDGNYNVTTDTKVKGWGFGITYNF